MGIEDGARLRFGFPGKVWEWRARLVLCGPFVGGAYIDTDPTPSKKVSASNIDVVPRNMGAIAAWGTGGHGAWGMSAGAGGGIGQDNNNKGNGQRLTSWGLTVPQECCKPYDLRGH